MPTHFEKSRPLSEQEMKQAMNPTGTVAARPTGRQGKIRTATVNPTSQKRKTGG
jgi:hypothetical protein